ncbi:glycosyl hydrolase [Wenjunlia vitaminophila]|uniref:Glycosyl hydrolase n=1 Tax=Wenjunlia vitaminophila TaxID=76728 RepID=A0A0T6LT12_WENVI|nr:glycosyl hydrolase [Wenjunlia vitaminophila]
MRRPLALAAALFSLPLIAVPLSTSASAAASSPPAKQTTLSKTKADTTSALAAICNIQCDAYDPALAKDDRVPTTATVNGRVLRLHISDGDAMGYASIDNGAGGDEVWLDRSFDGGKTWTGGSKLGDTYTPSGRTGWRTMMYNVDDWNTAGVGALRACGKAGDRPEIACTPWARSNWNAWSRSTAAATALMMSWNRDNGKFDGNGWWSGANALTAVIDNIKTSGMPSYKYAISRTYDLNINAQQGQFRNDYLDDTGWWGLAWVAAYDATGDSRYLNTARADADHMYRYWTTKCGGGVQWHQTNAYKNAITNELFLHLNAALHNRIPGDTEYLRRATTEWTWFKNSGMINSSNLINDGLNGDTCANNGQPTWTYNQGVILGGLTELYRATGDTSLLTTARTLANASTTASGIHQDGILRDPSEPSTCGDDGASFKGPYIRGLGILNAQLGDHPYSAYIDRQADAAYTRDRNALHQYGRHWYGPMNGTAHDCQHSALSLFNAAEMN